STSQQPHSFPTRRSSDLLRAADRSRSTFYLLLLEIIDRGRPTRPSGTAWKSSPSRRCARFHSQLVDRYSCATVVRKCRNPAHPRSEEHTSELQSLAYLVC